MPNMTIHKTAIIEDGAQIADGVFIGPYCHIGSGVSLAKNVCLKSHVVIAGDTEIGENTQIFPFASIGHIPQDLKFHGEKSKLVIGSDNVIREHVTMNPGTKGGGMITQVGNNCLFMMSSHIAHDCIVGNNVILANNATLAGHVELGDFVIIGGLSAIHQFVRVGHHAMIGGMSAIESDIIPYGSAMGDRANLAGLNLLGLKRQGVERETIHALRGAYRMIFAQEGTLEERLEDTIEHFKDNDAVMDLVKFIQDDSSRAICLPKNSSKAA
jgi:UDP-N-acetylglucosamine acyltransferase